ncbi:MAG: DNA gyrase subunit B [Planctomycetota bacterium]|nr:DNA gyrase subunit B [Planctomycetota bacterium]
MGTKTKNPAEYDSNSIQFLKDLEGVRRRPAMYIGDTSFMGFHHLLWEIVDNSVDEALAGYATEVYVTLNRDGSATVVDDGRGIPVDMHPVEKVPAVELVLTKLHAGGKFDGKAYAVSGGLHGVGAAVVNALSEETVVEVFKDGKHHRIDFSRGLKTVDLAVVGKSDKRGTRVTFRPDRGMFQHEGFDYETVRTRLREMAYLMGSSGLRMVLEDENSGRKETFHYPEGLVAYIRDLTEGRDPLTDIIHFLKDVEADGKTYGVEVALRYTDDWNEGIYSFANNIRTADGGTHLSGFRSGLTRTLNLVLKGLDLLKKSEEAPAGEDYKAGLYAVISLKIPDPQFEGQTKGKLGSREAASVVESVVNESLGDYLDKHPEVARIVLRKALLARDARDAARKQRDLVRRKGALSSGSLPGKLADCQSKNREETELYIVEGDSAGGSAKTGRDRRFQAILPLKGKILNVEKNNANRVLANTELQTMIQAIGAGIAEDFDPEKARYGKIIIMTDADVDGSHIRTLIMTFLFRQMRGLIETNRIYVACPPLYRLQKKGSKEYRYIHEEDQLRSSLTEAVSAHARLEAPDVAAVEGEALRSVMGQLQRLDRAVSGMRIERRGCTPAEFVAQAGETGELPIAVVTEISTRKREFFWTHEDLEARLAKKGAGAVWQDGQEGGVAREEATLWVFHLHERATAQAAMNTLRAAGFPILSTPADTNSAPAPSYRLSSGKDERMSTSALDLVHSFRDLAMKQMDVQRYKGLGEMNPDQLWESTMDPARRMLKRIRLDDAFEADRTFSMLMGDETEPRRLYIEQHAHEVENLDV